MSTSEKKNTPERLFPFVLRARKLILGRQRLEHSKSSLQFILITTDISENSRQEILTGFAHYPVVQVYTSAELEKFFNVKGTKVVGFAKSTLSKSVYAELKQHRINTPPPAAASRNPEPPPSKKPGDNPDPTV